MQQLIDQLTAVGLEPIVIDDEEKLPRYRETNVEFITRVMDFCPHGALGQAFILHALDVYCQMVEVADEAEFDNGLFSSGAWKGVGKWMQGELDARFAKG